MEKMYGINIIHSEPCPDSFLAMCFEKYICISYITQCRCDSESITYGIQPHCSNFHSSQTAIETDIIFAKPYGMVLSFAATRKWILDVNEGKWMNDISGSVVLWVNRHLTMNS
jgi:hypothetical protein